MSVVKYFNIARERYEIMLRRKEGQQKPWTDDPIFQNNRFCCVSREDDKTTVWFRENIRDHIKDPGAALIAIATFRWFNNIEIGTILQNFRTERGDILNGTLRPQRIKQIILAAKPSRIVTGAYIIKTPNGMNKLDGVVWCLEQFWENVAHGKFEKLIKCKASMEEACTLLQQSPFLGRFMSYQIAADARYTCLLENAPDIMSWAQPGPGSTRGIGRVFYNDPEKFRYGSAKDEKKIVELMVELLQHSKQPMFWPEQWPAWDMQTVQNWLCEYSKYETAEEGGSMKRKFK